MKPAAVALIDYFATDLALATNRSFAADKPLQFKESEFVIDVSVKRTDGTVESDRRWQVTLDLRHQPGPETNFPYSFRVALVGQFTVATWAKTEEERTVRIHGASVLYGMGREIVRVLTGRGPYRPVLIPTVNFYHQKSDSVAAENGVVAEGAQEPYAATAAPPSRKRRSSSAQRE